MSKTSNESISEKMAKLDGLLAWFEGDDFEIEAALEKFGEAKKLADDVENDLREIKNTVTVVGQRFDRDEE